MLTKQCARCKKIIPYGLRYCEACQPAIETQKRHADAKRAKYYDQERRDKQATTFYNSAAWKLLSKTRLQKDEYRCQDCWEIATEVHHEKPIKTHWHLRFDI
ncbi:MAG: hypothetical protein PHX63_07715, partial [Eubacteriales bacterium]|nr:hypothetical protein [Eubacteriales bacterium]